MNKEADRGQFRFQEEGGKVELRFHEAALRYRLLEGPAFEELKADIQERGQQQPIAVWRGLGLDGRNRLRACNELGVEPTVCHLPDDTDPWAFVESANYHRRHLTTEEQQRHRADRIERVATGRREGKSLRELAEEEGVSQPQILRDLKRATDTGVSVDPPSGKVVGKDGKERPATRPTVHVAEEPSEDETDETEDEEDAAPSQPRQQPAPRETAAAPRPQMTQEERDEKAKLHAETDARQTWLKRLVGVVEWVETYAGGQRDFAWFFKPDAPGAFDHQLTRKRLDAVIALLGRVRNSLEKQP